MNVTLGDVCQLKRNPFKSFPFYGMFHLLLLIFRRWYTSLFIVIITPLPEGKKRVVKQIKFPYER